MDALLNSALKTAPSDLLERAGDAVLMVDGEDRILYWNQGAERLYGWTKGEAVGQIAGRLLNTVFPGDVAAIHEALARQGHWAGDLIHTKRDGTRAIVASRWTAGPEDGNRPSAYLQINHDITEHRRAEEALRQQTEINEVLFRVGTQLSAELDAQKLVQAVTDAATRATNAAFGAFFYNSVNERGESYLLYTLSGVPREAFASFPMPRNTPLFEPTFRGQGVVRLDDVTQDPRYGKNAPHRGMPAGHLPVRSYLAVPVASRSGEVLGGLFFGHPETGRFTERDEKIAAGIAGQAAIAIDNARLYAAAQAEIGRRQQAEERLRLITDHIPAVIGYIDREERYRFTNAAYRDWFGVEPDQLIGRHVRDVLGPDQYEKRRPHFEAVLRGETVRFEAPTRHYTLGVRQTEVTYVPDMSGESGVRGFYVLVHDVTDRKQTEDTLRFQKALLEAQSEAFTDGILVVGPDGGILSFNQRFLELWGIPPEVAKTRSDKAAIDSVLDKLASPQEFLARVAYLYEHPEEESRDEILLKDGRVIERYSASVQKDGVRHGRVWFFSDITARKQAEAEVRTLNARLEEMVQERTLELIVANRELESFCYSVSHDLRAPLRSINGFSQAILEDCGDKLAGEAGEYLRRVRAATERMAQLIDGLLDLSRLTRKELGREAVDLSAQAEAIAADLRKRDPERSAVFRIAPGLTGQGDPELLRVVLQNLLENAWKFSARRAEAVIEFGRAEGDRRRPFYVRDNGAGFDMAYSGKLFGAFQRLHDHGEFPGTGIGLATVQRIVHRHGGRVWAEGWVDKGATFYFSLGRKGLPPAGAGPR
jgi:PAS domain S-box-containing protein